MQEVQMNGFTYKVEWIHAGQYRPYGDSFYVATVITDDTNPDSILELMKSCYNNDVPLKKDWNPNDFGDYFAGYCEIESIDGGFKYTKCLPYDD